MTQKITILGAGSFGTALAKLLANEGRSVCLWSKDQQIVAFINSKHKNPSRLPEISLPESVCATSELEVALADADLVVSALPMKAVREVWTEARKYLPSSAYILSATKGIEADSLCLPNDVLLEVLPVSSQKHIAFLSGPSFALELAKGLPTAATIASQSENTARRIQNLMSNQSFRAYFSTDIVGVELGGALKNVIAIAAGVAEGLGLGQNAQAALITRGIAEIARLGAKMGADSETFSGLSGLGDLVLTCTGNLSRNRSVGIGLGQGQPLEKVIENIGQVAEGVNTAKSIESLSAQYDVEMPISRGVFQILFENAEPKQVLIDLMTRKLKHELA